MKYLSKIFAGALILGLTACSNDEPNGGDPSVNPVPDGKPFYSSISFSIPSARSGEANEGEEIGQDYENNVGSILVVVASKENSDYQFISCALNNAPITGKASSTHTIVFQNKEALFEKAGSEVYVFAYCNPSDELRSKVAGTLSPETGKYENGLAVGDSFTEFVYGEFNSTDVADSWRRNAFLMTSIEIVKKTLPNEEELKTYDSPTNPLPLGTVPVIRTASRFDFRDASPETNLTYPIYDPHKTGADGGKLKVADVTLKRAALFNLRNQFYYLPRVLAQGAGESVLPTLCPGMVGMEFGVNGENNFTPVFVMSPSAATYSNPIVEKLDPTASDAVSASFAGLEWQALADVVNGTEDSDSEWNEGDNAQDGRKGYHIWRYASENTFAENVEPTNDKITGIVFEAQIVVPEDFGNKTGDVYETMYLYDGILYASAISIDAAVKENPSSVLANAFEAAFTITRDEDGNVTKAEPKDDETLANLGFTPYKPNSSNEYLCYYYYFNRHVDDNNNHEVGPMEFATVRNNVYKIAVKDIKKFGAFTPESATDWDTYFSVDVEVRNWVVRVNDGIEF